MLNKFFALVFVFLFAGLNTQAQNDPVLFTVGDTPVHVSEFKYIYTKTNGKEADFSKKSLEEYLDLYTKFKLKVQKAKDLQLDTVPALKRELDGYRRQLSNSYLTDKTVKNKLLQEVYKRQKKDVNISHILVRIAGRNTPKDTLSAYKKIMSIKAQVDGGKSFEEVAKGYSEDTYSKQTGGKIGWITSMLPSGFYNLETAAYNTAKGKCSLPVRTKLGYHLVKVNEERPARGVVELAHIVIFKAKKDTKAKKVEKNKLGTAKERIVKVYEQLQAGDDFEQLARTFSDDKKSAVKGGYLGFFGINKTEKVFEDAAFALANQGDYSQPIESATGWHIIKLLNRPKVGTFDEEKNRIQAKVEKDLRFQDARLAMIKRIKKENHYHINQQVLNDFTKTLTKTFITNKWKAPKKSSKVLFSFAHSQDYTLGDFTDYLLRDVGARYRLGRNHSVVEVVAKMLDTYSDNKALEYEKSQLAEKYPDFRSLMREYEEGIILFEVTKSEIWDKATQDSIGLVRFYEKNKAKYKSDARAEVSVYTLKSQSDAILKKVRRVAKCKSSSKVLGKINRKGNLLTVTKKEVEKGKTNLEGMKNILWKKRSLSPNIINKDNSVSFVKIEKILPTQMKTLEEARGYVIADYQDELERQWIEQLRKEYPVKVNTQVFNALVK